MRLGAVDQLDRAVMPELQALGEFAHSGVGVFRETFDRQHKLMLLRLYARLARFFLTDAQKTADLVSEFRERAIFRAR